MSGLGERKFNAASEIPGAFGVIRTADLLAFYKKLTMPVIQMTMVARLSPSCPSGAETEITVKMYAAVAGRV